MDILSADFSDLTTEISFNYGFIPAILKLLICLSSIRYFNNNLYQLTTLKEIKADYKNLLPTLKPARSENKPDIL